MLTATTGFMLSLHGIHQAEKERFWRNQKDTVKRIFTLEVCVCVCVCVCAVYICVLCDNDNFVP